MRAVRGRGRDDEEATSEERVRSTPFSLPRSRSQEARPEAQKIEVAVRVKIHSALRDTGFLPFYQNLVELDMFSMLEGDSQSLSDLLA